MKHQLVIRCSIILVMVSVAALMLPQLSRLAFSASHELLTFRGDDQGLDVACAASNYETCPGQRCTCLSSTGSASGDLTGIGFATLDLIVTNQVANQCQQFNAAMFIIAPKDLEEVDFSGTSCDGLHTFSGNYVIAVSQAGNSGSGTFSGRRSEKLRYSFTFF